MRHVTQCLLFAVGAAAPAAAQAQSPRGTVDQVGSSQPVGMQQLSRRSAATPTPQLSTVGRRGTASPQLTRERGSGRASPQLPGGARSALPPQPLSRPEDGRTTAVERVAGRDSCDPARNRPAPATCAHVIESRAVEFTRRDTTPLSPEQRIIMEQQVRDRSASLSGAARRLAGSGDAPSIEAQGVASFVLGGPPPERRRDKSDDNLTARDEVTAIVSAIIDQPRPQ